MNDDDEFNTFLIDNDPAKLLPYSKRLTPEDPEAAALPKPAGLRGRDRQSDPPGGDRRRQRQTTNAASNERGPAARRHLAGVIEFP
jgi:hypothetical protein